MFFFSLIIIYFFQISSKIKPEKTEYIKQQIHKLCGSVVQLHTSAGFQSNFWSWHRVCSKIASKQKWVMAVRVCLAGSGQRWKGNWALQFGFWGYFVSFLIKWRYQQTDPHFLKPAPSTGVGKWEVYPSTRSLCFVLERLHTCTYLALYISDFRLKSKNVKHWFCCNVESPFSLNRRHFLKKMSTGGKERASCMLGPLPCPPAYSWWFSSDGAWQAAPWPLCGTWCTFTALHLLWRRGALLKEKTV